MSLILRYMKSTDIPSVMEIETASFTPSWGEHSFHFEINESRVSYMVVLSDATQRPAQGLRRWWEALRGVADPQETRERIMSFGGLWHIEDEAHISTIASHPQYRGRHYGEVALAAMIQQSIRLKAQYVVLEVRVSNMVAQNLYLKYGFRIITTKRAYYQNNKEDAYDMRLYFGEAGVLEKQASLYRQLQERVSFVDAYTRTPHPRLER
jgi:[ribosomal protein S18]-alanine N-acetyltransferase